MDPWARARGPGLHAPARPALRPSAAACSSSIGEWLPGSSIGVLVTSNKKSYKIIQIIF